MQIAIIEKDRVEISSREIAELTGKEHRNVKRDIENALSKDALKFEHIYLDSMNRQQTEYILPKNIALGIVSGYSFELRMKIINRLDELENKKNKPLTYEETMQNALLLADSKVKELEFKIKNDIPLVSFATTVQTSINSVLIRDWVKSIGLKEKDVRAWLSKKGYIYKNKQEKWRVFATDTAKKYFEAVPSAQSTAKGTFINYTIKITGEGQIALTDKILIEVQNGRA